MVVNDTGSGVTTLDYPYDISEFYFKDPIKQDFNDLFYDYREIDIIDKDGNTSVIEVQVDSESYNFWNKGLSEHYMVETEGLKNVLTDKEFKEYQKLLDIIG